MLRMAASPRASASSAASAPRLRPPTSASNPGMVARSLRIALPLDVHSTVFDPDLVAGHVGGARPAQELPGANVEAGVVQRALEHVADELAGGKRRACVAAGVPQREEGAVDVRDEDALAIDDDPLHRARRQLGDRGYAHEAVEHAVRARIEPNSAWRRTAWPRSPRGSSSDWAQP